MPNLSYDDHVVTAYADDASGPGWTNAPVFLIVHGTDGLREECLQPHEQTPGIRTVFPVAARAHASMLAAVQSWQREQSQLEPGDVIVAVGSETGRSCGPSGRQLRLIVRRPAGALREVLLPASQFTQSMHSLFALLDAAHISLWVEVEAWRIMNRALAPAA